MRRSTRAPGTRCVLHSQSRSPGARGTADTALVNEAYLRLVGYTRLRWQNRAHFFAVSAQVMRRVLVDYARRQNLKRGAGVPHLSLDDGTLLEPEPLDGILALHDALDALAMLDPRKARVVEMRFFGGLTVEEVAGVLDVSAVTVMRDWSSAKASIANSEAGRRMDPERWRQVDGLLQHVLGLPATERDAYLRSACGEDEALAREVARWWMDRACADLHPGQVLAGRAPGWLWPGGGAS